MIASLPMYDLPELHAATDAWWAGLAPALRRAGVANVPERLQRNMRFAAEWSDPALLISQCCGWDLTHDQAAIVTPVATPVYAAPGCAGPNYRSLFVVRVADAARGLADLRGRRCAMNMPGSQSGYNTLRYALARLAQGKAFFDTVLETGSHAASLAAVQSGAADLAAIDCVSYALLARYRPQATAGLRVLGWSRRVAALPYVTRADVSARQLEKLRTGLRLALTDTSLREVRDRLLLMDFVVLPASAYRYILTQEQRTARLGYPTLR